MKIILEKDKKLEHRKCLCFYLLSKIVEGILQLKWKLRETLVEGQAFNDAS